VLTFWLAIVVASVSVPCCQSLTTRTPLVGRYSCQNERIRAGLRAKIQNGASAGSEISDFFGEGVEIERPGRSDTHAARVGENVAGSELHGAFVDRRAPV